MLTKPGKFTEKFQITDGHGNELRPFSIHVDPSQLAASTEGGEKPTLPQLINVPLPSGKPLLELSEITISTLVFTC